MGESAGYAIITSSMDTQKQPQPDDETKTSKVEESPKPANEKGSPEKSETTPLPASQQNQTPPAAEPASQHASAGVIVLQWLTYAFWGWTLLAVIWLVYIVVANLILGDDQTGVIPYVIAATVVLLPLSFVCDLFYSRQEPAKKVGAATVVMVIHAVIFALFGIGILISAVFLLVGMLVNDDLTAKEPLTALLTLLISAALYAFTFLRTLNPKPSLGLGKKYRLGMLAFVGVFVVLAFAGPIARSWATREDRALTQQLPSINREIQSYASAKNELPAKLSDIELSDDAKKLIDKGLVEYKSEGKKLVNTASDVKREPADKIRLTYEHRYQLCATFTAPSDSESSYSARYQDDEYSSYLSVYAHSAGKNCYKLKTTETSFE